MTTTAKIGFVLGSEVGHLSPAKAASLEATGCDSLWFGGHLTGADPSREPVTALARLAALTERVTLGSAVLLLPLYPAVLVAKQFAEIDAASGGRVALGVGIGSDDRQMAALGVAPADRGARADEALEIIRALWDDDAVNRTSAWWALDGVRIAPSPIRRPPIIVAGRARAGMRRAARLGDGWMPTMFAPEQYAQSVEQISNYAQEVGRSIDEFEWLNVMYVRVDDSSEAAWDRATEIFAAEMHMPPATARAVLGASAAVGTVDAVAGVLARQLDAGVNHLVLRACTTADDFEDQIARIMTEVVPLVQYARGAGALEPTARTTE